MTPFCSGAQKAAPAEKQRWVIKGGSYEPDTLGHTPLVEMWCNSKHVWNNDFS
jgi:hypothetical protein